MRICLTSSLIWFRKFTGSPPLRQSLAELLKIFRPHPDFTRPCLQSQFPDAILPKQTPLSDIPPHHLHRPMSGLVHDRPLGGPGNRRRCGMSGPKRMPRELCHRLVPGVPIQLRVESFLGRLARRHERGLSGNLDLPGGQSTLKAIAARSDHVKRRYRRPTRPRQARRRARRRCGARQHSSRKVKKNREKRLGCMNRPKCF